MTTCYRKSTFPPPRKGEYPSMRSLRTVALRGGGFQKGATVKTWKTLRCIEVSDSGDIRWKGSIKPQSLTGKYYKVGRGYLACKIGTKLIKVHRLVAEAFIPNPDNLPQVNHKNGVTTDNRAINLEWVTPSQNQRHAIRAGLRHFDCGEAIVTAKLTSEQVEEIRLEIASGCSHRPVAKRFGISKTQVGRIARKESWKHLA